MSGFILLHQLCSHVAIGCILGSMARILGTSKILALVKPFSGIRLIVVQKAFYQLVNKVLCLLL